MSDSLETGLGLAALFIGFGIMKWISSRAFPKDIRKLKKELASLSGDLTEEKCERMKLEKEVYELERKVDELETENETLRDSIADYEETHDELLDELRVHQSKVNGLIERLEAETAE